MLTTIRRQVQAYLVQLNDTPFEWVVRVWYQLGLFLLIRHLRSLPSVQVVYGTGSYFFANPLYGYSDIDLILVFKTEVHPHAREVYRLRRFYQQLRFFFPFLGNWKEQQDNLVFLQDAKHSKLLPSNLRFRAQRSQLVVLFGDAHPVEQLLQAQALPGIAALDELAVILQYLYQRSEASLTTALFWQRILQRLQQVAEVFACTTEFPEQQAFTLRSSKELYFEKVDPEQHYRVVLSVLAQIDAQMLAAGVSEHHCATQPHTLLSAQGRSYGLLSERDVELAHAPLLSDCPEFLFFNAGSSVPLLKGGSLPLAEVRAALRRFATSATKGAVVVLRVPYAYLLVRKELEGEQIIALPLRRYPIAEASCETAIGATSIAIDEELVELRNLRWSELAEHFAQVAERVEPYPFPCVYREDQQRTLDDMCYLWRIWYHVVRGEDASELEMLCEVLSEMFPEAAHVLQAVKDEPRGNNIYRCLHEFTAQLYAGCRHMSLSPLEKKLGCSVGIVTKNRASFLVKALTSLQQQVRMPDEVVVFDNGSSDETAEVVQSFTQVLPLRYYVDAAGGVVQGRNRVLEVAQHEIVCFVDDDCVMEPDWLLHIEQAFLRADNIGIVGGGIDHESIDPNSSIDSYYRYFHHALGVSTR